MLARLAVVLTTLQNKLDHATQEEAAFREQARAHLWNKDRAAALNSVRRADNKKKQASELCRQIQLIERQRLQLETMQTTEDVVNTQRELADVMKRANLSTLAADAETAAETHQRRQRRPRGRARRPQPRLAARQRGRRAPRATRGGDHGRGALHAGAAAGAAAPQRPAALQATTWRQRARGSRLNRVLFATSFSYGPRNKHGDCARGDRTAAKRMM